MRDANRLRLSIQWLVVLICFVGVCMAGRTLAEPSWEQMMTPKTDWQGGITPVTELMGESSAAEPDNAVLHEEIPAKESASDLPEPPKVETPKLEMESGEKTSDTKNTPVTELNDKGTGTDAHQEAQPEKTSDLPPLNRDETDAQSEAPAEAHTVPQPTMQPDAAIEGDPLNDGTGGMATMDTDRETGEQATESNAKTKKPPKEKFVYKDLPAMVVFPVLRHGNEKAFGDVSILFANEFANRLEKKFPNTRIHNPVYSVEELRIRGLSRVYNQMMDYYIKAGRPEPKALKYLLDELSAMDGNEIGRAVFVEADVDLHHQQRSYRPKDLFKKIYMDQLPAEQRYYVNSRVKVYDTTVPHQPLVWSTTWNHPVKTTGLYNVTSSVFQDSDSVSAFSYVSRIMSRIVITASPKKAYRQGTTEIDTAVEGQLYENKSSSNASPSAAGRLTDADRRTIERLLREQ